MTDNWMRPACLATLAAALALAGCNRSDGRASRSAGGGSEPAFTSSAPAASGGAGARYGEDHSARSSSYDRAEAPRAAPPLFHGEPMWSDSRKYTAEESAAYHFQRAGPDLGAKTLDDFLTKVHQFVNHTPPGVEVIKRSNGDRLLYDPKANLFAVVRADGAPRTIFKPDDGAAYWEEQKQKEADRANGQSDSSYSSRRRSRRSDSYNASDSRGSTGGQGQDGG